MINLLTKFNLRLVGRCALNSNLRSMNQFFNFNFCQQQVTQLKTSSVEPTKQVKAIQDPKYKIPLIMIKPHTSTAKMAWEQSERGVIVTLDKDEKFQYSHHKLNNVISKLRGKYLIDAEKILKEDQSKGSKLIQSKLRYYKKGLLTKLQKENLVLRIKTATVGGKKGHGIPMFRAKGKVNMIYRKKSSFRLQLEVLTPDQVCQQLIEGKASPGLAQKFRENLYKSKAPYEIIRHLNFILTSKGRRERSSYIKSLVQLTKLNMKNSTGKIYANALIRKHILNELGKKIKPIFYSYFCKKAVAPVKEEKLEIE